MSIRIGGRLKWVLQVDILMLTCDLGIERCIYICYIFVHPFVHYLFLMFDHAYIFVHVQSWHMAAELGIYQRSCLTRMLFSAFGKSTPMTRAYLAKNQLKTNFH